MGLKYQHRKDESEAAKRRIIELYKMGKKVKQIAELEGFSRQYIYQVLGGIRSQKQAKEA